MSDTPQARARIVQIGWDQDLAWEPDAGPPPEPTGAQVLVQVEACGVCYRDCIDRAGRFPFIQTPVTPGHEAVGRVIAAGPDVTEWAVGDRVATMHRDSCGACDSCQRGEPSLCTGAYWVYGLMVDGGYARYVLAPQSSLYAASEAMSAETAAVLHCTFGTAWRGLNRFGRPKEGDRVLITGANGGVGAAAVKLASRIGADVTAVVRSEEHRAFLMGQGASRVVVDPGQGFHKKLDGERMDLALDCVGQPTFNASLRSLRMGGGMVVVGNVVPVKAELNLGYIVVNGIWLVGSSGATRDDMREVVALFDQEPFEAPIHARMALAEADAAQRAVQAGGLTGRIVLMPEQGA